MTQCAGRLISSYAFLPSIQGYAPAGPSCRWSAAFSSHQHRLTQFAASSHCLPSPDGSLIATLLPSTITFTTVQALEVVKTLKLPPDLAGGVTTFIWAPSSRRVLLSVADQIHVFSALDDDYHAVIRNPASTVGKSTFLDFGATDDELYVFSAHGIKLSLYQLHRSKAVEIANPKYFNVLSAPRGFSVRSATHHLALLTRTQGKDFISIHSPDTREVQRSWSPDTTDAAGLAWTPNGRWLIVWESPSQGHKVLFYTPDGNVFKSWQGPYAQAEALESFGSGVRCVSFSPNGEHAAITDSGRAFSILSLQSAEGRQMVHPLSITPKDTTRVWQEQGQIKNGGGLVVDFIRVSRPIAPSRSATLVQESKTGGDFVAFDVSSNLLATRLEEAPSTAFIWDIPTSELRAVLLFRASISKMEWHPQRPEQLLLTCEGEDAYKCIAFLWDPLSDGPRPVDFASHIPANGVAGRTSCTWLRRDSGATAATLFFSDHERGIIGQTSEDDDGSFPWQAVPRTESLHSHSGGHILLRTAEDHENDIEEGLSELDDTFHFKKAGFT